MQPTNYTSPNANEFASTFYFFATHNATAEKNKKSLQANASDIASICANLRRHSNGRTEARTDNSTYKKVAVQWLNEALLINVYFLKEFVSPLGLCFVSSFTHNGFAF